MRGRCLGHEAAAWPEPPFRGKGPGHRRACAVSRTRAALTDCLRSAPECAPSVWGAPAREALDGRANFSYDSQTDTPAVKAMSGGADQHPILRGASQLFRQL